MRALISVFDKDGVVDLAKCFIKNNIEIISSGGTYKILKQQNIPVKTVEEITGFKECLDGRVKTLHPLIHGGILANRKIENHMETLANLHISTIDFVVVNLYPFEKVISNDDHTFEEAIENIDIGGPTLLRSAAKNFDSVTVLCDKNDYLEAIERLNNNNIDSEFRLKLAKKVFKYTSTYDNMISNYLEKEAVNPEFPNMLNLNLTKKQSLRYGENPHQLASFYVNNNANIKGIESAISLWGKELSYNNINDSQGAIDLTLEFSEPVCVAVKHSTPCGVAIGENIFEAYTKAYECDPLSIFGGIVCFNREVDAKTAAKMSEIFLEVVIAPSYADDAFAILSKKKNIRILTLDLLKNLKPEKGFTVKGVGGGVLIQQTDDLLFDGENKVVTSKCPSEIEKSDLEFAMKVVKHVKSNAIVIAKNGQTLGIGGGEVSRIWAANAALERSDGKNFGAVLASDAFFPFPDVVERCAKKGISAIIQPGGSINDKLSIIECDKNDISMTFTGIRHFKH